MKVLKTLKQWNDSTKEKMKDVFADTFETVDVNRTDTKDTRSRSTFNQAKTAIYSDDKVIEKEKVTRDDGITPRKSSQQFYGYREAPKRTPLKGHTGSKKLFVLKYTLDLTGSTVLDDQGYRNTEKAFYKIQNDYFVKHLTSLLNNGEKIRVSISCLRNDTVEVIKDFGFLNNEYLEDVKDRLNKLSPNGRTVLTKGILDGDDAAITDTQQYIQEKLHVNTPIHIIFSDYASTEDRTTTKINLEKILEKEKEGHVINVFAGTEPVRDRFPTIEGQPLSQSKYFIPFTNEVQIGNFFSIIRNTIDYNAPKEDELDYNDRTAVVNHMKRAIEESIDFNFTD